MNVPRPADLGFPRLRREDWLALAEASLNGGDLASLVSLSEDGFEFGPIEPRREAFSPLLRQAAGRSWTIVQRLDDVDPARANEQALVDLDGGASGLALAFAGASAAAGFGLPMRRGAIERALEGVMLDLIHLRMEPHRDSLSGMEAIRALCDGRGLDFNGLDLDLCLDGVGAFAFSGSLPGGKDEFPAHAGRMAKELLEKGFNGRVTEADGRVYHEAGATDAQELGAALATWLFHLRSLTEAGLDVATSARAIGMTLAVDQTQFMQIAKLRAARLAVSLLLEECGLAEPPPLRLHAETSRRMMARHDPHTNILRTTLAAFAAGAGGADSLSVLPHTCAHGLPDAQARRLARNTQVILEEETGLGRVGDPAAGSGGIEALTDALAGAGWNEFRKIEAEGGIFESLRTGALQNRVLDAAQARARLLKDGRLPLIGVTIFPPDKPHAVSVLLPTVDGAPPEAPPGAIRCQPLPPQRLSETLEAAR